MRYLFGAFNEYSRMNINNKIDCYDQQLSKCHKIAK